MANTIKICSAAALFLLQIAAFAQNTGSLVHTIRHGETVYSIARIYQVSPEDILKANPSAAQGIRKGGQLLIPQVTGGNQSLNVHTVAAGETLYRLSQQYGVSTEDICRVNPGLTANTLQTGMKVRIPAATAPDIARSGCKEMYKVGRKETIYGIARAHGLTEAELKAANPEMQKADYQLKKGSFICIPYPAVQTQPQVTPAQQTVPAAGQAVSTPKNKITMGVILPFKGDTPENARMVEFYRGVLMAVDSIKKAGVSVGVFAFDSGRTPAEVQAITENHPIAHLDFIIGPLYVDQIGPLSDFCHKHHIRLAVPFASQSGNVYDSPDLYAVTPSRGFTLPFAAELTTEVFGQDNIIILDSQESNSDAADFTAALEKQLGSKGRSAKKIRLNDGAAAWQAAMSRQQNNVIVPNSSGIKLLNQLFPLLKDFTQKHPEYKIKLAGYPEWQTYTSNHLENFYRFDTYVFSPFYYNPMSAGTTAFERNYQQAFRRPTGNSSPRMGMLGFDIAYYFLKGISLHGNAFDSHLSEVPVSPYQHRLTFERAGQQDGFVNREMHFIHYTPAHNIELIRLKR